MENKTVPKTKTHCRLCSLPVVLIKNILSYMGEVTIFMCNGCQKTARDNIELMLNEQNVLKNIRTDLLFIEEKKSPRKTKDARDNYIREHEADWFAQITNRFAYGLPGKSLWEILCIFGDMNLIIKTVRQMPNIDSTTKWRGMRNLIKYNNKDAREVTVLFLEFKYDIKCLRRCLDIAFSEGQIHICRALVHMLDEFKCDNYDLFSHVVRSFVVDYVGASEWLDEIKAEFSDVLKSEHAGNIVGGYGRIESYDHICRMLCKEFKHSLILETFTVAAFLGAVGNGQFELCAHIINENKQTFGDTDNYLVRDTKNVLLSRLIDAIEIFKYDAVELICKWSNVPFESIILKVQDRANSYTNWDKRTLGLGVWLGKYLR